MIRRSSFSSWRHANEKLRPRTNGGAYRAVARLAIAKSTCISDGEGLHRFAGACALPCRVPRSSEFAPWVGILRASMAVRPDSAPRCSPTSRRAREPFARPRPATRCESICAPGASRWLIARRRLWSLDLFSSATRFRVPRAAPFCGRGLNVRGRLSTRTPVAPAPLGPTSLERVATCLKRGSDRRGRPAAQFRACP